jgi:hypothetical protein
MHAKLKRYEDMLKSYGVNPDPKSDSDDSDLDTPSTSAATNPTLFAGPDVRHSASSAISKPKLVTKGGSTRYFEK